MSTSSIDLTENKINVVLKKEMTYEDVIDGEREMMKIEMKKYKVLSVNEVSELVNDDVSGDIVESGVYRILSGSRGVIEEVVKVGELNDDVEVMSESECVESLLGGWGDDEEELSEYVNEWYYCDESEEDCLRFSFTEEEFDYYVKVKV